MWVIKVIFALSLAITAVFGCATSERLYHRTATNKVQLPQSKPVAEAVPPAVELAPSVTSSITEQPAAAQSDPLAETREKTLTVPLPDVSEAKSERVDRHEKSSAKPLPTVAAQSQRGLLADNRLLELLEKDLDKAVEQPPEHRRLQFSPEVIDHPKVRHFIKYYSVTAKNSFAELLARSGKYVPMIATVLTQEGLPRELGYLALLESQFVLNTTSRNGAAGLWQFIASTGRRYGLRIDQWVDERRDPVKSTRAAAAYLKDLHDYYGRWFLATAAYNAGPGNVDKALRQSQAKDFWSIKAKEQLSEETRDFVPKFIAIALIASDPEKYGIHDVRYEAPLDYEEIEITAPMKLERLAEIAETDLSTLKSLNPALLRHATPPGESNFRVNVPVGRAAVFLANPKDRKPEKEVEAARVVTHEVKKGETLISIARRYGLTVRALMDFNGLRTSQVKIGQKLAILLKEIRAKLR
jgi:membrane-bound lytic murein transglycosylase D